MSTNLLPDFTPIPLKDGKVAVYSPAHEEISIYPGDPLQTYAVDRIGLGCQYDDELGWVTEPATYELLDRYYSIN